MLLLLHKVLYCTQGNIFIIYCSIGTLIITYIILYLQILLFSTVMISGHNWLPEALRHSYKGTIRH